MSNKLPIIFKPEQFETIEELAALNYTPEEIALYLGMDINIFLSEYSRTDSEIRLHFDTGILKAKAEIEMQNLKSAKAGNITHAQRFDKLQESNRFEHEKKRIIYGED